MAEAQVPLLHEDTDLFRAVLNFTERHTDFSARLIEKDCFHSVLLALCGKRRRQTQEIMVAGQHPNPMQFLQAMACSSHRSI